MNQTFKVRFSSLMRALERGLEQKESKTRAGILENYNWDDSIQTDKKEEIQKRTRGNVRFSSEIERNPSALTNVAFDVSVLAVIVETLFVVSCFRHICFITSRETLR